MEFEELQKIWDSQNNQTLYTLNEKAMYNQILLKKRQAYHISHISELLLIAVNAAVGILMLILNLSRAGASIALYALSAWMLGCAVYVLAGRMRRIKGDRRFDRSMRGDLAHALAIATYQVRLSQRMRWSVIPLAVLLILGMWETGKPVWFAIGTSALLFLAYYASGWEHSFYKARKRSLETLQAKLEDETYSGTIAPPDTY